MTWIQYALEGLIKSPTANAGDIRDAGLIPGLGRSPREGNSNPLQYSCLENPMDGGTWQATVHGVTETDMTEWLHFSFFFTYLPLYKMFEFSVVLKTYATSVFLPAVIMDLKQDFWSIRGHIIYFAFGLLCRNVKKHRVRLIPVAIGTTKQLVTVWTPTNKKKNRN